MAETYHTLRQHHRRKPPSPYSTTILSDDNMNNTNNNRTNSQCNQNCRLLRQPSSHLPFYWINNLVIVFICSLLFLHSSTATTTPPTPTTEVSDYISIFFISLHNTIL